MVNITRASEKGLKADHDTEVGFQLLWYKAGDFSEQLDRFILLKQDCASSEHPEIICVLQEDLQTNYSLFSAYHKSNVKLELQ